MSASESAPPIARSRKWCTVLCTRRPSATNQKSMMPSGATTSPTMPVSSATSRTAVSSGVSPSSMWPLGRDHNSRPRRSVRPMRAARGPVMGSSATTRPPADVSSTRRNRRPGRPRPPVPAMPGGERAFGDSSGSIAARNERGADWSAEPDQGRTAAALLWLVVSADPLSRRLAEPVPPAVQATVRELVDLSPVLTEVGQRFTAAGYEIHLVGGSVRDALLTAAGEGPQMPGDLDLTTNARPEEVLELLRGWASSTWNTGSAFGTVGAEIRGLRLEITTFRADRYDRESRNPEVAWGDSLVDDLQRRDFTVNAMAVSLGADRTVTDPFGGLGDLLAKRLRTPGPTVDSFADDPLRMLRAVRFVAQLQLTPDPEVVAAMTSLAGELSRITPERVQGEFSKTLLQDAPRAALELFVDTGLADVVLPELSALRMEIDEHHQHKDVYTHSLTVLDQAIALEKADPAAGSPDLVLRLAALLHDIGKQPTRRHEPRGRVSFHHHEVVGAKLVRKRLTALRYPKDVVEAVARLTFLHLRFHGYGDGQWTDSAVRRYVTDAGDLLPRLHKLVRSDSTTRNRKRAAALSATYDSLVERIAQIAAEEDLARVRPDLDGNAIMAILGIPPGREVGEAWRYLKELRLERGPLAHDEAEAELRAWW